MRILIVNQYFGGQQTPTGRMAYDVARAIRDEGHEAVALSGSGSYAVEEDAAEMHGIEVLELPVLKQARLLQWGSYWTQVAARINKLAWDRALLLTDPPFLPSAARIFRTSARPVYLWTMDLYPEALAARGDLRPDSAAYRGLRKLNDYGLQDVEGIIALGERQKQRLQSYAGCPGDDRCVVVPPWDLREMPRVARQANRFLADNGWTDKKIALYAGNLGEAHAFSDVLDAARQTTDDSWQFVFVVRGARRDALAEAARGLSNVSVFDYVAPEMTGDLLWAADVHLITMRSGWEGVVVPSKLYGALSTHAPVLFVGPEDADTAAEVARYRAGLSVPGGAENILQALRRLDGTSVLSMPRRDGPSRVAQFVLRSAPAERRLPLAA